MLRPLPTPHWAGFFPPKALPTAANNSSAANGLSRTPTAPNFCATESILTAAALPDMAMMATSGERVRNSRMVVSLVRRATILGVDAAAGEKLHYMESASRVLVGLVAGGLAVCAMGAGAIAPGLLKSGSSMVVLSASSRASANGGFRA